MPAAFFALAFQTQLQYHYLNAGINSDDDGATLCKNFGELGPVIAEMTGLICILMYLYWAKYDLYTFIRRSGIHKCLEILECQWAH